MYLLQLSGISPAANVVLTAKEVGEGGWACCNWA